MNHLGNFPSLSGVRRISTVVTEMDLLASIKASSPNIDVQQFLRYFALEDNLILAVIDLPYTPGGNPIVQF